MTQEELKQSSDAQAKDCLEHDPAQPVEEVKRIISEHISDAYLLGLQEGKIVEHKKNHQDGEPEFNSST
jgi:hypothetical protein